MQQKTARVLVVSAVVAGSVLAEPAMAAPSWCDRASTEVEQVICADDRLGRLDAALNEAYERARSRLGASEAKALQQAQRSWLRGRSHCAQQAALASCLILAYESRLNELERVIATAASQASPPIDDRRARLRQIQRLLAGQGYDPGPADGLMGGRTRAAILAFQRAHRLAVDGEPSADLLEHLRDAASTPSAAAAYEPQRLALRGLRIGDHREDLLRFRFDLADAGNGKDWRPFTSERSWRADFHLGSTREYAVAGLTSQQDGYLNELRYVFTTSLRRDERCDARIQRFVADQRHAHGPPAASADETTRGRQRVRLEWKDPYSILTAQVSCGELGRFDIDQRLVPRADRVFLLRPELRELQDALAVAGVYDGVIDGVMDAGMAAAISRYQGHADLPETGLPTLELLAHAKNHAGIVARAVRTAESEAGTVYGRVSGLGGGAGEIQITSLGPVRLNAGPVTVDVVVPADTPGTLWVFNETAAPLLVGAIRVHRAVPRLRTRWTVFVGQTGNLVAAYEGRDGQLITGALNFWVYENDDSVRARDRRRALMNRRQPEAVPCADGAELTELSAPVLVHFDGPPGPGGRILAPVERQTGRDGRPDIVYLRDGDCRCRDATTGRIDPGKHCLDERVWAFADGEPLFTESIRDDAGSPYT
jgi:peptidoglycan hydrolase-like protein with peptidoglycan-binding domain